MPPEDSYLRNTDRASEPFRGLQNERVLTEILPKTLPERCVAIWVEGFSLRTDICIVEATKQSSG